MGGGKRKGRGGLFAEGEGLQLARSWQTYRCCILLLAVTTNHTTHMHKHQHSIGKRPQSYRLCQQMIHLGYRMPRRQSARLFGAADVPRLRVANGRGEGHCRRKVGLWCQAAGGDGLEDRAGSSALNHRTAREALPPRQGRLATAKQSTTACSGGGHKQKLHEAAKRPVIAQSTPSLAELAAPTQLASCRHLYTAPQPCHACCYGRAGQSQNFAC